MPPPRGRQGSGPEVRLRDDRRGEGMGPAWWEEAAPSRGQAVPQWRSDGKSGRQRISPVENSGEPRYSSSGH